MLVPLLRNIKLEHGNPAVKRAVGFRRKVWTIQCNSPGLKAGWGLDIDVDVFKSRKLNC